MISRTAIITTLAILSALPASAGRIIATPFAETPKTGTYRFITSSMEEERSTDKSRNTLWLDYAATDQTELGMRVIYPEDRASTTQCSLQQRVVDEAGSRPTISVGVWDAGRINKFSGEKTGGSFFIAASKTVGVGEGRPPIKLSVGAGTNRLDGFFGGVIIPVNKQFGVMAEYVPENGRLPKTDSVNAAVYYHTDPNTRLRLTWTGGNPMFDVNISGMFR